MLSKLPGARQAAVLSVAVFGINAAIAWPLFRAEYLTYLFSNEGMFMAMGRYFTLYWPHVAWFSWFNGGTMLEGAYFPLVPALVGLIAAAARMSPAHAFHLLVALAYALGPVFLFLFARKISGRTPPALAAALLWTLFSPAALVPDIRHDMGTFWGLRRLHTIVYWGETPHNVALSLLPLFWLLLVRLWERPSARRLAPVALVAASIMLSNAFGLTVTIVSAGMLLVSTAGWEWRRVFWAGGALLSAYLLICGFVTPTFLKEVAATSQMLGGDYRLTPTRMAMLAGLVVLLAGVWYAMRPLASVLRFAGLFTVWFGAVSVLWHETGIGLLPSAHRYILEAEAGACLLLAFALGRWWRREVLILALALAVFDWRFARRLIQTVDITQSVAHKQAVWIAQNLPGERVMVSGAHEFLFNLFADNPQLSAGHEGAANWVERVAVYTIYSGENAGPRDGAISILWLKAFGCGAITVPAAAGAPDYLHPFNNPGKFEGLLPRVWREDGTSIYRVPLRSASLAHVVPSESIVASRPIHGLDVGPLTRYVEALEDPAMPAASLVWKNPDQGRISAKVAAGQAVTVQITYDPGWRAAVAGRPVRLRSDGLGMMAIEPGCTGDCTIDLWFDGGAERRIGRVVGLLTALGLTIGWLLPRRVPTR